MITPSSPTHDHAELAQRPHFVRPLRDRCGETDQVAGEERVVVLVTTILLAGGDHQRGAVRLRVGQVADRVAEPGRGVEVEEGGTPRRLRVAVGHRDRGGLLQRQHVLDVVDGGERVHERQLGRPGVAEDVTHALRAEHLEQRLPSSARHRLRTYLGPFRSMERSPR
jgi:hypothetical protein